MSRARVRDRIGPWAVLVGTAVLLSIASLPTISRAALGVATRPDCASARSVAAAAAAPSRSLATSSVDVSARLTSRGHFAGRSLRVTTAGGATSTVSLPPESFVAPRRGDALVYTLSSRGSSEVHVLDTATGCDQVVARPPGVVRSGILAPDGSAVYVHSVTAARRDAGVSRYAFDGSPPVSVVGPIADDARFGRTFGTQLAFSTDGATLAVQSCGASICRTRLVELASGAVETFDALPHGAIVGVTETALITFGACPGMPCSVVATDRATRATVTLADEAWSAALAEGTGTLSMETAAGIIEVQQ